MHFRLGTLFSVALTWNKIKKENALEHKGIFDQPIHQNICTISLDLNQFKLNLIRDKISGKMMSSKVRAYDGLAVHGGKGIRVPVDVWIRFVINGKKYTALSLHVPSEVKVV